MAGRKNKGMLHGVRPVKAAPPFAKGDPRTLAAAKKGAQAMKDKCARFKTLREAALAVKDLPSTEWPSMSNGVAAVLGIYQSAAKGDAKALRVLAELQGELVEKVKVENVPVLKDDIPRAEDPPTA